MKQMLVFSISIVLSLIVTSASKTQDVSLDASNIETAVQDTTPRPPQVVTTYPSSVSDEALLGDTLSSSIKDLDISFGSSNSASAKTPNKDAELKALRTEVQMLREEVEALRAEVKVLHGKKQHGKWPFRHR